MGLYSWKGVLKCGMLYTLCGFVPVNAADMKEGAKMNKSCLTCKYEPDWGEFSDGELTMVYGSCKYLLPNIKLPSCVSGLTKKSICKFKDNSGVYTRCPVWEKKEEKNATEKE